MDLIRQTVMIEYDIIFLLLFPKRLVVPEMADKIAKLAEVKGVTPDDLLTGLEEVGEQLYRERYGGSPAT